MKASYKMRKTIEMMERKYGELEKEYFVEPIESNRVGRGFWDGCRLTSPVKSVYINIIVAHDGTWWS